MKREFNFKNGKRNTLYYSSLSCLLGLITVFNTSCLNVNTAGMDNENISSDSILSSNYISEPSQISTDNSYSETYQTKSTNPTGYNDYLDIPAPNDNLIELDSMTFNGNTIDVYGETGVLLIGFGYDNPCLLSNINDALGTSDLNCYNVNYFQNLSSYFYSDNFRYDGMGNDDFYQDVIRYIMEEDNLRMWIDEIPAEFFQNKSDGFNELVYTAMYLSIDDYYNLIGASCYSDYLENNIHSFDDINYPKGSEEYQKIIERIFYDVAFSYNCNRARMIYGFDDKFDKSKPQYGNVVQIRNIEGKNVLIPTEEQYNKIFNDYKLATGYTLDPLHDGPETREALEKDGIDLEAMDEAAKLIGGVKFEKDSDVLGASRTRS